VYVLEGPARRIFERKLGPVKTLSLTDALQQATILLCSTGWQSDLEFEAIKQCRLMGKPAVAFLDHWVNYKERFVRHNKRYLPNQIWVGDSLALKMAQEIFPGHPIFLEENPYFLDIKKEIATIGNFAASGYGLSILYVCEPIKEHAKLRYGDERHWGYTEDDALRYFLNNLSILGKYVREIRIRPHPAETREKYTWLLQEFDLPIVVAGKDSLLVEIVASDIVAGCESMAMVIGLLAGKRVISCIPPGGKKCGLPHQDIVILKELMYKD
jgi:hypothetical protein